MTWATGDADGNYNDKQRADRETRDYEGRMNKDRFQAAIFVFRNSARKSAGMARPGGRTSPAGGKQASLPIYQNYHNEMNPLMRAALDALIRGRLLDRSTKCAWCKIWRRGWLAAGLA